METLTLIGAGLVLTGAAFYIIGCFINLCNAGQNKEPKKGIIESSRKSFDAEFVQNGKVVKGTALIMSKTELDNFLERESFKRETKITLASSKRLSEEAVKHLN